VITWMWALSVSKGESVVIKNKIRKLR
jgi:hypothetical protein